jgi:hypothetical protein
MQPMRAHSIAGNAHAADAQVLHARQDGENTGVSLRGRTMGAMTRGMGTRSPQTRAYRPSPHLHWQAQALPNGALVVEESMQGYHFFLSLWVISFLITRI